MNFKEPIPTPELKEIATEELKNIFEKIVDSEFQIKGGAETARPKVRKLYTNKALRALLLDSEAKSGEIQIMGVTFEVVTGRKKPDGEMASIIHQESQGLVQRYLLSKYGISEEDMDIEVPPLIEVQTGKFNTSVGERFPRKNTIYATALLRDMLEVKVGDELEIDGETYTIKSGRRLSEDQPYTNYTTKSLKKKLDKHVAKLFEERY